MNIPEFSLEGKNAIVIAGSRGIGKGIAMALAEAGADTAVTGYTNKYVETTAKEIEAIGRKSSALTVDATHGEDMDFLARQVLKEFSALSYKPISMYAVPRLKCAAIIEGCALTARVNSTMA